jgi:hypothetical protein
MTPKAKVAFEIYRDLGPSRTLDQVVKLGTHSHTVIKDWSRKYEWVRLVTEHDHSSLREALGRREMDKECATQIVVDAQGSLIAEALEIARDKRVLPILDRQGNHIMDPDGKKMYKPVTRQSTRLEAIKWLTGLVGHVPVKRTEIVDRTGDDIDELTELLATVHPDDLDNFMDSLRRRREADANPTGATSDKDK